MENLTDFCAPDEKGMYIVRSDGGLVTYALRVNAPDGTPISDGAAAHTLFSLMSAWLCNTPLAEEILSVEPVAQMGFFVQILSSVPPEQALRLMRQCFDFIGEYRGEIPYAVPKDRECGDDHNPDGARRIARDMVTVLSAWSADKMTSHAEH